MAKGRPAGLRLETAERRQNEFQQTCLDDLLSSDHRAVRCGTTSRAGPVAAVRPGANHGVVEWAAGDRSGDPDVAVALRDAGRVGSARLLDRLCQSDAAYLWLLGGVTVNYHTLADFRTGAGRCWTSFCRARWRD